jgi:hypothetical protein
MSIDQIRTKVKSSVWQALAQSGVNLSAVSSEDQNKLVDTIADHVLVVMNDVLDEIPKPTPTTNPELVGEEKILWQGRPFLSLNEYYTVTTERIKIIHGLIGKDIDNYELIRVQDIDVTQSFGERIMGLGDIHIKGHDASNPDVVLNNIKDPTAVYELLRKTWLSARKRYGLQFREQM